MIMQFLIYVGIIVLYLYFIIVGIELNIVEYDTIIQNKFIYNYLGWINAFYFPVVIYFIFKMAELIIDSKCSNNRIDVYINERYRVIEKKLIDISSPKFFIYLLMGAELIMNFIYFMFGKSFIENNKTAFMEIRLFELYAYPKMIVSCVVSISYCLIIVLWLLLLLDAFFCSSFFVNNMTKVTNSNNIVGVKKKPKENYLRKRRNRISVGDNL
jgi:hypothetical protein